MLLAFATALGIGLAVSSPASAVPTGCTSGWSAWYTNGFAGGGEGNWGKARFCYVKEGPSYYWQWQVQDIKTDGYAVHLEMCSDWAQVYFPYTCTNPGQGYNPLFGLVMADGPGDNCPQSAGPVDTTQFPASVTPDHAQDPTESYYVVRVVLGRCEGGAYQNVGHFELLLSY